MVWLLHSLVCGLLPIQRRRFLLPHDVRLFHERLRVRRAAGADACEEARARGLHEEPPALRRRVRFAVGVGAAARRVPSLRQERRLRLPRGRDRLAGAGGGLRGADIDQVQVDLPAGRGLVRCAARADGMGHALHLCPLPAAGDCDAPEPEQELPVGHGMDVLHVPGEHGDCSSAVHVPEAGEGNRRGVGHALDFRLGLGEGARHGFLDVQLQGADPRGLELGGHVRAVLAVRARRHHGGLLLLLRYQREDREHDAAAISAVGHGLICSRFRSILDAKTPLCDGGGGGESLFST